MFTGIIEDVGTLVGIRKLGGRWELAVRSGLPPAGIRESDSIAVNGVCLTVTRSEGAVFHADASFETLDVTTLRSASAGDRVNLERALLGDSRFGGHIVMGHVDGVGRITSVGREGDSIRLEIETTEAVSRYIVKKGSVAIDGISLTVNEQRDNRFTLNVIPYSAAKTTIGSKNLGDQVNVETDILGRYVEKFVTGSEKGGVDIDFLYRHGYIKGR
ncbi:MAG: riboflavin synthase [Syntrophorhabdales bacterium]|jgi:riboflavin synthase